ncbi:DNA polymerase III, subunit gamma and tau [Propionigenium maris DSM 9537]|uniref:DNA polymerase III subunit gamma/tau n=1 Tax=Propionigenium maris DSM 9537 TaxID=1123000 RepID=A0A9W6GLE3_9FUSO|nr:DNA polymerase III subunit gamma/tau [Propionigenium maris]GLI55881.1 DNA polymerase III, subunit gamma and tau [Propionigenium maris DSM 9537]
MHQTLYRKYRPADFSEVAGEQSIIKTIKNSLKDNKMSHAYLFTGPRGVGKTTTARLIAKGLNCLTNGITDEPCNTCENCVAISEGTFIDMIEIDAASNRGIDEIRGLKDKINYRPAKGRKKVYIIDEVHMLTREAFNAILKTLEEPPSHVIFILATTEPEKILPTIISRCQRYDFKPLSYKDSVDHLKKIAKAEEVMIDEASLKLVYEKSGGSMRDAISILEKLISSCYGEDISLEKAQEALGVIPEDLMIDFMKILDERDLQRGMEFLDTLWEESLNVETFFKDLAGYVKTKLIAQEIEGEKGLKLIGDIFDTLTKFKFEEDKRLLGYVILNKNLIEGRPVVTTEVVYREVSKPVETEGAPGEAPKEAAAPVEIGVTIEEIKRVWPEAVTMARRGKITMAAFLAEARPVRVEKNIIFVGFSPENAFHKDKMEEAENNKYLQNALRGLVHPSIEVKYEIIGERRVEKREENVSFADKVVEFFDGELI